MNTDTTTIHKTNGRKTTNDTLTTLLRAGVIASIMMLVLGAGMAAGTAAGEEAEACPRAAASRSRSRCVHGRRGSGRG
jgi:hypothetical protein